MRARTVIIAMIVGVVLAICVYLGFTGVFRMLSPTDAPLR
jgi:hypothetical protein